MELTILDRWLQVIGQATRLILNAYTQTDSIDRVWIEEHKEQWNEARQELSTLDGNLLQDYLQGYSPEHAKVMLQRYDKDLTKLRAMIDTVIYNKDHYRPDKLCTPLADIKDFDMLFLVAEHEAQVFIGVEAKTRKFADVNNNDHNVNTVEIDFSCLQGVIELQTDRCKVFIRKAVQNGYLTQVPGGFKRTDKLSKSQLAYILGELCGCDYENGYNCGYQFPDKVLCSIFNETRLGKELNQVHNSKFIQSWRDQLDTIFELK